MRLKLAIYFRVHLRLVFICSCSIKSSNACDTIMRYLIRSNDKRIEESGIIGKKMHFFSKQDGVHCID